MTGNDLGYHTLIVSKAVALPAFTLVPAGLLAVLEQVVDPRAGVVACTIKAAVLAEDGNGGRDNLPDRGVNPAGLADFPLLANIASHVLLQEPVGQSIGRDLYSALSQ